jgi:hypothetical protein
MVDIVAQDGLEWVKVSTITSRRLVLDMAKAGWDWDDSSDEEYDALSDDDDSEGILKQAEALIKAAKATRVRYCQPKVRMLLTNIRMGEIKQIDGLIDKIKGLGIEVITAEEIPTSLPIADVLKRLAVDPFADFTDVLNIDCTVLLALVSDLSHSHIEPEAWHHKAVVRQIEVEREEQLLPSSLWPACAARRLVCTREAAQRFHEIVQLIGTDSEKERTRYLMDDDDDPLTREQRLEGFQRLSTYGVPKEWNIPIKVLEVEIPRLQNALPTIASTANKDLSPINQSVFMYGWAEGITTISSNRTVAKEIETAVETHRTSDDERGPHIWLCPTARSLVGKEKNRK